MKKAVAVFKFFESVVLQKNARTIYEPRAFFQTPFKATTRAIGKVTYSYGLTFNAIHINNSISQLSKNSPRIEL